MISFESPPKGRVMAAMFLVAGTCIGGGMLALPVATGISGFFPSLVIMALCWFCMTATALMLLEVSLWMGEDAHVISMTSRILGLPGKAVSWLLYLFICYASIVAYSAGGGIQIAMALKSFFGLLVPKDLGALIFILVFGSVIYMGNRVVGRVNAILFIGMIAAYFALIGTGIDEVNVDYLFKHKWSGALMSIPLLLTAFSFQTMVPSLTPYLNKHAPSLRIAVIGGTILAFLVYAIWQWLILGIVPVEGPNGLAEALRRGEPATQFLREHVGGTWIISIAEFFAFFAIVTSFLGIALGLFDFLSDGLSIQKKGWGKVVLGLLIVVPTIIFATQFERAFLVALDTSGGFGDSILNGIIPVLMVWIGRYRMNLANGNRMFGGKPFLIAVLAFFVFTLGLEIMAHTGQIVSIYEAYDYFELQDFEMQLGSVQ